MADTTASRATESRRGAWFYHAAFASSLIVGALQMQHVRGGWITNYGADVFGTAWVYAIVRQGRTTFRWPAMAPWVAGAFVLAGCVATEVAQRWLPGTFDPYDLVAFTATIVGCVALDLVVDLGRA
ncbi:hypothetical protein [Luteitalea sp. TBR-22]|uniref:hypothetical protein n=1 Tax=Luteitalea sp. TBR-22 TaxID=2802971 RepID=UPI001AF877B4|nr:hypothetical protein [Luteitalea sp. TBR-22]